MSKTCSSCGIASQDEGFFHTYHPTVRGAPLYFCPVCWAARERRQQKTELVFAAVVVVGGLLLAAVLPLGQGTLLARLALWLLVFECFSTVVHELGHAAAALAVGMRVRRISFGSGQVMRTGRLGSIPVQWRSFPTCGYVQVEGAGRSFFRLRHFLVTAGGPATNFGLAALAWWLGGAGGDWSSPKLEQVGPWHALLIVNVIILLFNLIPMRIPTADPVSREWGRQVNDGLMMLQALVMPSATVQQWRLAEARQRCQELVRAGDHEVARTMAEAMVEESGGDPGARYLEAEVMLETGEIGAARERLVHIVRADQHDAPVRALALAALAEANLRLGTEEMHNEAETLSRQALALFPADPHLRLVRGRVLLARGWVEKSVEHLQSALAAAPDDPFGARVACSAAEAEAERHAPDQARHYLQLARRLDPNCSMIESATVAVARAEGRG